MQRQPIDLDDPQLTAYALGEMPTQEIAEFELRLEDSPLAKKELMAMKDVMSLLGEGLEKEWMMKLDQPVSEDVEAEGVIAFQPAAKTKSSYRKVWGMGAAAACAALIAVGAMLSDRSVDKEAVSGGWASVDESAVLNSVDSTDVEPETAQIRVPTLFLAEELRGMEEDIPSVNAGYLEEGRIIKASFQPHSSSQPTSSSDGIDPLWLKQQFERVDSYLPPVTDGNVSFEMKTGSYDGRPAKTYLVADRRNHTNGTSSVFVRGVVTLEGELGQIDMDAVGTQLLAGFDPALVSESSEGTFSADLESGKAVALQFSELQSELSGVVKELSSVEGNASASQVAKIREQLQGILNRGKLIEAKLSK